MCQASASRAFSETTRRRSGSASASSPAPTARAAACISAASSAESGLGICGRSLKVLALLEAPAEELALQPEGNPVKKNVLALLVASALPIVCAKQAQAAAFGLAEQGVSGLGNAYAGAAAAAEDASTVWWNPAGMSRLPSGMHLLGAAHVIIPSTKFTNGSSANPFIGTSNGGDAGETIVLPQVFFA